MKVKGINFVLPFFLYHWQVEGVSSLPMANSDIWQSCPGDFNSKARIIFFKFYTNFKVLHQLCMLMAFHVTCIKVYGMNIVTKITSE